MQPTGSVFGLRVDSVCRHFRLHGGSSPRLWGTLAIRCHAAHMIRFIPTPVGNASLYARMWAYSSVHPHACGERYRAQGGLKGAAGSIPTPVGNACASDCPRAAVTVHPHACGERGCAVFHHDAVHGSSPRLWGTPPGRHPGASGSRFIPTPVGNALGPDIRRVGLSVHPHACGERSRMVVEKSPDDGSSPRLWGTQWMKKSTVLSFPVHPHACGERSPLSAHLPPNNGSSPRLWGTLSTIRPLTTQ